MDEDSASQTNGICGRFQKTRLNQCYRVAFRKKIYRSIKNPLIDVHRWLQE